jgi:hypothetical protein
VAGICALSYGAGSAFAAGLLEYSSQRQAYQNALEAWCRKEGNDDPACYEDLPEYDQPPA